MHALLMALSFAYMFFGLIFFCLSAFNSPYFAKYPIKKVFKIAFVAFFCGPMAWVGFFIFCIATFDDWELNLFAKDYKFVEIVSDWINK